MNAGQSLFHRVRNGKGLLGAIIQTLSTNILIQIVNIGTGVITARILAPHGRGELAAMIMWPGFFCGLMSFGLQTSLIYQMRTGEHIDEFIAAALVLGTLSGIAAGFIGFIGLPFWLHAYPQQVVEFARWAMLTAPITLVGALLYTSAQGVQEFSRFNKFRALPNLLILCTLGLLAFFHMLVPRTAALAYLLSAVPIVILNGVWACRRFDLKFDKIAECSRMLLGFGIRAWGMDFIGVISDQVDRVLVVAFLSPQAMGLYVVAQSSARLFAILPGALSLVMSPKIVRLGPAQGAPLLVRTARITFLLMCAGAVPLGLVAPSALGLVYGPAFLNAAPVFQILLAEAVFGGATWLLAQGFAALGKPGRSTLQQMAGLFTSVPLLLLLVPKLGVDGACFALLASTMIRTLFAVLSYRFLFNENLAHFIPRLSDAKWLLGQLKLHRSAADASNAT